MNCVYCENERVVKNGRKELKTVQIVQSYLCNECGRRFNEHNGTPMTRLRTPGAKRVKSRDGAQGKRGRTRNQSHRQGSREIPQQYYNLGKAFIKSAREWSPKAPERGEITIEGDELYTRVGENLPPRKVRSLDN
jgi:hypothetical protein